MSNQNLTLPWKKNQDSLSCWGGRPLRSFQSSLGPRQNLLPLLCISLLHRMFGCYRLLHWRPLTELFSRWECTVLKTLGSAENNYPKRLFALLCYGISDKPVFIELVCTFYIAILKYLRKQMKMSTEETDRLMWSEHKRKQCPYNLIFVSDLHS